MVDSLRRKKLAFYLRQLASGLVTNDDFETNALSEVTFGWLPEQYYRSKEAKGDDAVMVPMVELCWLLYSDKRRHRLKEEEKLDDKSLKYIARCILFLHSNKEYEWPYFSFVNPLLKMNILEFLFTVVSLGIYHKKKTSKKKKAFKEWLATGDYDYWPFLTKADYFEQLAQPPFFSGKIV